MIDGVEDSIGCLIGAEDEFEFTDGVLLLGNRIVFEVGEILLLGAGFEVVQFRTEVTIFG